MNELSTRAKEFLKTKERETRDQNRSEIAEVFLYNGIEAFEPLIDFEMNYSGYIFYVGLTPIEFKLLWGAGYPFNSKTATLEFDPSEESDHRFDFVCARSDCPIAATLDEKGKYYEYLELQHESFDKAVEGWAIWEAAEKQKLKPTHFETELFTRFDPSKELGLMLNTDASDSVCQWYEGQQGFLRSTKDHLTILEKEGSKMVGEIERFGKKKNT